MLSQGDRVRWSSQIHPPNRPHHLSHSPTPPPLSRTHLTTSLTHSPHHLSHSPPSHSSHSLTSLTSLIQHPDGTGHLRSYSCNKVTSLSLKLYPHPHLICLPPKSQPHPTQSLTTHTSLTSLTHLPHSTLSPLSLTYLTYLTHLTQSRLFPSYRYVEFGLHFYGASPNTGGQRTYPPAVSFVPWSA
eukprot:GHVN01023453.1.p2 GENE.GHVN01023453.1~~GHVN01023453.1.p2  ORF type:complete len:186 (-),score=90.22 GHVN01023453.1:737-1294(-)